MKNGGIILTAIALLFIGMYIYSYSFEYFAKLKENRKLKRQLAKEAMIDEHRAINEKARKEKFEKLSQRSQEIKEELKRLAEFKDQLVERQVGKKVIQH